MEREIEELTLLLLYLTCWEEEEKYLPKPIHRSWKGYRFEILDKLEKKGFITQGKRSKSVYLTEEGISQAEELKKRHKIT